MNHYCTYFDRRYAAPGLALWLSLRRHDPTAVLWVLCLDAEIERALRALGEKNLRPIALAELEAADTALAAARANRTATEYIFTLTPCVLRFLLAGHPEIEVITYVDADMAFFSSPAVLFEELGAKSVLIVGHRFPPFLRYLETRGRFNVGVLCFRNNDVGRAVLDDWRVRCIEWCHDRVEPGRYADQGYLDAWPENFSGVVISAHPGVNLAPWNWLNHACAVVGNEVRVDGRPLVIFHFARFRRLGPSRIDSGQLEFGVMPLRLRSSLYGCYCGLLDEAGAQLRRVAPGLVTHESVSRGRRAGWKTMLLYAVFGPVWRRIGPWWISGRLGIGRFSGRFLAWKRRVTKQEDAA